MVARQLCKVGTWVLVLIALVGSLNAAFLDKTYGLKGDERAFALVQSYDDSGFCLAGRSNSYSPNYNILVVKVDANGSPLWSKRSTGRNDEAHSMIRTKDMGYVITGWFTKPTSKFTDIFALKLDKLGNLVWGYVYSNPNSQGDNRAYSIIQTSDGGYAIAGSTKSFGPAPYPNYFILKLDPKGNFRWENVYWMMGSNYKEEAYGITEVNTPGPAGNITGLAVVGRANILQGDTLHYDAYVMLVDSLGNSPKLAYIPGKLDDEAYSVITENIPGAGSNIIIAGWTNSFAQLPEADIFVWKVDMNLQKVWGFVYGWPNGDEQLIADRSLINTADGGYAVSGWTGSQGPGIPNPNFLFFKLKQDGSVSWARVHPSIPGADSEEAYPMIQSFDLGYGIAGWTNSFGVGGEDFHFVNVDAMGNRPKCVLPVELPQDTLTQLRSEVSYKANDLIKDTLSLVPVEVQMTDVCPDTTPAVGETRTGTVDLQVRCYINRIELNLARDSHLTLNLLDATGRQSVSLADGFYKSGRHSFLLPSDLSHGVYFVEVKTGQKRSIFKAIKL